jgi:type VI secretion system secreted protein Hcp
VPENGKHADYFLKIDGIEGESEDARHPGELQIQHFEMGMANRGRRGDYKVGKAVFEDARFLTFIDQSYPKLKLSCATGEHLPKAVLTCRKAGKQQQEYLKITFLDVTIKSCAITSSALEDLPVVEFTIGFAKKQFEYKEQKQDGTLGGALTALIDLKANIGKPS